MQPFLKRDMSRLSQKWKQKRAGQDLSLKPIDTMTNEENSRQNHGNVYLGRHQIKVKPKSTAHQEQNIMADGISCIQNNENQGKVSATDVVTPVQQKVKLGNIHSCLQLSDRLPNRPTESLFICNIRLLFSQFDKDFSYGFLHGLYLCGL